MTDSEKRVRDAFERVRAPEELRRRTLAAIEERRDAAGARGEGSGARRAPLPPALPAPAVPAEAPSRRRAPLRARAARVALAACVALALVVSGATYAVAAPTAYVGIEVNPSFELAVNRFDAVVGERSFNEDGAEVLAEAEVVGRTIADALAALAGELSERGYLGEGSAVSVTVSCDDEGQYSSIESASRCLGDGEAEVSCEHASSGEHHAASEAGMGVGRWRVWRELVDAGVDVSASDAAQMSLSELLGLAEAEGVELDGAVAGGEGAAGDGGLPGGCQGRSGHHGQGHGAAHE